MEHGCTTRELRRSHAFGHRSVRVLHPGDVVCGHPGAQEAPRGGCHNAKPGRSESHGCRWGFGAVRGFVAATRPHGARKRHVAAAGKGRDVPSIAKQLFISENTVRSHSKSIYKKLDIHSKQELLDLLETIELDTRTAAEPTRLAMPQFEVFAAAALRLEHLQRRTAALRCGILTLSIRKKQLPVEERELCNERPANRPAR